MKARILTTIYSRRSESEWKPSNSLPKKKKTKQNYKLNFPIYLTKSHFMGLSSRVCCINCPPMSKIFLKTTEHFWRKTILSRGFRGKSETSSECWKAKPFSNYKAFCTKTLYKCSCEETSYYIERVYYNSRKPPKPRKSQLLFSPIT